MTGMHMHACFHVIHAPLKAAKGELCNNFQPNSNDTIATISLKTAKSWCQSDGASQIMTTPCHRFRTTPWWYQLLAGCMLILTLTLQWLLNQMDPGVILPQPYKGSAPDIKLQTLCWDSSHGSHAILNLSSIVQLGWASEYGASCP